MKWIVRVMVALLAFVVGVWSSQLSFRRQPGVIQTKPVASVEVAQSTTPPSEETWRRIIVKGRFSFFIPSYLKDDGHSVSRRMAVGAFRKESYDPTGAYHLYYYSDETEQLPKATPNRYRNTTRSEVVIGGKRAIMITEIPAADEIFCIHDAPEVSVYFLDIGRGRNLHMRLASGDEKGIEVAKRIIESIEFP